MTQASPRGRRDATHVGHAILAVVPRATELLDLLDWKRSVFALYGEFRASDEPERAWRGWRERRDELARDLRRRPLPPRHRQGRRPRRRPREPRAGLQLRLQPVVRLRGAVGLPARPAGEHARRRRPRRRVARPRRTRPLLTAKP